jgi:tripartite-type tricarboxylate transporter receptor subunit TctC
VSFLHAGEHKLRSFPRKRQPNGWIVLGTVLALASSVARAQPVDEFYRGRQISWILSADAGGGYSAYALAFAPYFSAHIPGRPKIVVQNMPGAGGIRAMLYLSSVAPKDGTTIGMVHSSVPFAPLYGIEGARFDPRQMNWIGSVDASTGICVAWHTSKIKTWQDMLEREFTVGGSGAGSHMETLPAMINRLFGAKMKVISGYKGGNAIYLAMERGEVEGRCGGLMSSINSTRPDWLPQGKVTIPIQIALERSPLIPGTPALGEFTKDQPTRQILQLFTAPQSMDRPILTPPGVPAERVAALRAAFHAAINDPGFIAEANKQHLQIQEIDGPGVAAILADAYKLPADVVKAVNDMTHVGAER